MILARMSPADAKRRAVERHADPVWLARQGTPAEWQLERLAALKVEQAELAADLQALGFAVESPWELCEYEDSRDAGPTFLHHLHREYSDEVRSELARALAHKWAAPYWSELTDLYLAASDHAKDQLAVVLSKIVTRRTLPVYLELIQDDQNGSSRILMLRALKRLRDPSGRAVLEKFQSHPVLGEEARRAVAGRSINS